MMGLLDENLIILESDSKTSADVIREASDIFYKYGYVSEKYKEAILERESVFPTGLPAKGMGVAIPHTTNEHVLKATMGVIIPKEPIEFIEMGSDSKAIKCEIIMPLVIKETKKQMDFLKTVLKLLQNEDLLVRIRDSKSKKEVIELLSCIDNSDYL